MARIALSIVFICFVLSSADRLLGGWSDADHTSNELQELATFAFQKMELQSNALYRQRLLEVLSAKKKLVAGMLYKITVKIQPTTCRKNTEYNDVNGCEVDVNQAQHVCDLEVWEKKWLNFRELQKFNCTTQDDVVRKRSVENIIGGGDHDYIHIGMFKEFINRYNKIYQSEEEMKLRFGIFRENVKRIHELQKTEMGTAEYGITEFADLTKQEFQKRYLGLNPALKKVEPKEQAKIPNVMVPPSFDWRTKKAVTPVKNQGQCGSCWAFSVTGNVEGQWAIKKQKLVSLSEQELVDCDTLDQGCNGGFMTNAYEEIIKLGGLEGESDYPYEGEDEKCHFQSSDVRVNINNYVNISKDEGEMAQWLYKNGPISIGINANAMQFYFGGVSHPWKFLCSPDNLDHGVLIVGYGESKYPLFNKTLPYWIVKNSWGPSWGEKGYYRVFRGDGTCGVNLMATSAVVN